MNMLLFRTKFKKYFEVNIAYDNNCNKYIRYLVFISVYNQLEHMHL